jgi:L-lactate utilization protein LutC
MNTSNKYDAPADIERIRKTSENLESRNIKVEVVAGRQAALSRLRELIPEGAEVMTGGSTTLSEIGFTDLLKSGDHPWKNLKDEIVNEKDEKKQSELRRRSVTSEYFLGSVHAVAETGEVVVASATGSQLPAYVFASPHVIWIVGTQKITSDLDSAIKRVREYVFPLENERMKKEGYPGSMMGKLVIFEKEFVPGRITLIFVKEKLGF